MRKDSGKLGPRFEELEERGEGEEVQEGMLALAGLVMLLAVLGPCRQVEAHIRRLEQDEVELGGASAVREAGHEASDK